MRRLRQDAPSGLAENTQRSALLIGLSNLLIAGCSGVDRPKATAERRSTAAWPEKSDASHARSLFAL